MIVNMASAGTERRARAVEQRIAQPQDMTTRTFAWSPQGARIAYISVAEEGARTGLLHVFDPQRGSKLRVGKALTDAGLTWLGGEQIACAESAAAGSDSAVIVCRELASGRTIATGAVTRPKVNPTLAGARAHRLLAFRGELAVAATPEPRKPTISSGLFVFDLDNRKLIGLGSGLCPAWATRRRALAFVRTGPQGGIFVAEPPAWEPRQIAHLSDARDLAWSPDDKWVAFVRTNRDQAGVSSVPSRIYSEVWLAKPDGS